jgi:hypothetical protein
MMFQRVTPLVIDYQTDGDGGFPQHMIPPAQDSAL